MGGGQRPSPAERPRPLRRVQTRRPRSSASFSPHQELTPARAAQTWKRPPGRARALPNRPLRQAGLPRAGLAPHPPGPRSRPPRRAPQLQPLAILHRPTLPFPAPTAGTAPAPPTPASPGRSALPGGDCRSPSAIFLPPGARPDACRPLTFHSRTHPPFPRTQSFLKRNEHRPAITENQELKSPQ